MRIIRVFAPVIALMLSAGIAYAGGSTAFNYQGRLLDAGEPANGLFNFEFQLWDADVGGNQIGSTQIHNAVPVADGLFVILLDFGADAFDNADRWLEVTVNNVLLSPRQPVTRVPYAIQTRGIFVDQDQKVFVGREDSVTFAEYFGFNAPVGNNAYGGKPFYGYAPGGNSEMWHYYDGATGNWHIHNGGEERLTVRSGGHVGVGTTLPLFTFHVVTEEQHSIVGENFGTVSGNYGVRGLNISPSGGGVIGLATASTGITHGVRGHTFSPDGYGVYSEGDYGGSGAKYFVQPHPYDPSKEIRFVCLEGNESGTYFRGSARLENGRAYIDVPEEFRLVSELNGLTVQVTAMGPNAGLWVESKNLDRIVVIGNGNVEFDYFVNGVRRGYADLELIRANHAYIPKVRNVPYGNQYTEGHRQILVENGILNSDFTPNEATAAMMGWTLWDPEPDELSRAGSSTKGESR